MVSISSVTDLAVPMAESCSQIDLLAYDAIGKMLLVESVECSAATPISQPRQALTIGYARMLHCQQGRCVGLSSEGMQQVGVRHQYLSATLTTNLFAYKRLWKVGEKLIV